MATKTYAGLAYSNGNAPASLLAEVMPRGIHGTSRAARAYLRKDAAASWNRAMAEVKAKTGYQLSVRGWNRSYAEQRTFFLQRYHAGAYSPYGDYRRWNGVQYGRVRGAAAAVPGTSNHGWGLAVDVNDFGSVGQWNHPRRVATIAILKKHGWTDTEGHRVSEPWHLVYDPSKDKGKAKKKVRPLYKAERQEWQRHLGVTPDGDFGPVTYRAIQESINSANRRGKFLSSGPLVVDGIFGHRSDVALVKYLNWLNKQWKYLSGGPLSTSKDLHSSRRNLAIVKALRKGDLIRRSY